MLPLWPVQHSVCLWNISISEWKWDINTLRPRQNGRRFASDTFKGIFLNENVRISIKISLKFVPKGPINNNPALVQIMAWRRQGDKPLSETMLASLLTHICVTRPQWVNSLAHGKFEWKFRYLIFQIIAVIDGWGFLHAMPWIPGGGISIFTAVIH